MTDTPEFWLLRVSQQTWRRILLYFPTDTKIPHGTTMLVIPLDEVELNLILNAVKSRIIQNANKNGEQPYG